MSTAVAFGILAAVAVISSLVARNAVKRCDELRGHITALEEQLELKRKWESIQSKNKEEANAKIESLHAGDVVGNALGVLSKPND